MLCCIIHQPSPLYVPHWRAVFSNAGKYFVCQHVNAISTQASRFEVINLFIYSPPSINVLLHLVLQKHNIIFSLLCSFFFPSQNLLHFFFDDALGPKLHLAHSVMFAIREASTCAFFPLSAVEKTRREVVVVVGGGL